MKILETCGDVFETKETRHMIRGMLEVVIDGCEAEMFMQSDTRKLCDVIGGRAFIAQNEADYAEILEMVNLDKGQPEPYYCIHDGYRIKDWAFFCNWEEMPDMDNFFIPEWIFINSGLTKQLKEFAKGRNYEQEFFKGLKA